VAPGAVDLGAVDTGETPGFDGDKAAGKTALADLDPYVSTLQERLYAEGLVGGNRSVLLVLQGMDTSGKGGTIRHSIGQLDPQGVQLASFKAPTAEERRHDFLWRIRRRVPRPGMIGIFDRSHYEDVLVARVRGLAPKSEIEKRYDAINDFEAELARNGTTVVKCFLHISSAGPPSANGPFPRYIRRGKRPLDPVTWRVARPACQVTRTRQETAPVSSVPAWNAQPRKRSAKCWRTWARRPPEASRERRCSRRADR